MRPLFARPRKPNPGKRFAGLLFSEGHFERFLRLLPSRRRRWSSHAPPESRIEVNSALEGQPYRFGRFQFVARRDIENAQLIFASPEHEGRAVGREGDIDKMPVRSIRHCESLNALVEIKHSNTAVRKDGQEPGACAHAHSAGMSLLSGNIAGGVVALGLPKMASAGLIASDEQATIG